MNTSIQTLIAGALLVVPLSLTWQAQARTTAEDPVLARGKNTEIRKSHFEAEKRNAPPEARLQYSTSMERIQRTIEKLILNHALLKEARDTGYVDQPDVKAELDYFVQQKLLSMYSAELTRRIKVPDLDSAARERYRLNQAKYQQAERVRASHILITAKSRGKEEALARAEEARTKALAGQNFKLLVKEYSEDPTARRNDGDLGFFPYVQMVEPFAKAAFAMTKAGEISPVVESPFGFHVIRYEDRRPAGTTPFEDVRSAIVEELEHEYRTAKLRELLNAVIDRERPEANMAEVEKLLDKDQLKSYQDLQERIRKDIQEQPAKK
ncbi:MAG: peptidylprolyl isomerase [Betaproteobacteria bacterium]|nr:peptidylprolyl isomerase [Betaproteobacteria bacterium]